ncbi:hypothetical protein FN909_19785 [Salmonella enterica subsp. enterica]|nr:hypothetical protein [Salmonella enterica subsp. enterica serovar Braenderup]ECQ1303554.1 hypothetical protein [Salmonella enterica subsp. enterica serovar Braenderup]ECQ9381630.1 hypothetical protein [Salmonella enterica subsp. enterica serovar Braenderup]HBJ7247753.1 hypothetical protein [Salmonella enterica subsp. enterica serovar Braenderup]
MCKPFMTHGRAVNKRGLTTGIHYEVQATSRTEAISAAIQAAECDGYSYVYITAVMEVTHE